MSENRKFKNPLSLQVDPNLFEKATEEEKAQQVTMRESVSFMRDAMRRLAKNKIAMICLSIIIIIGVILIVPLTPILESPVLAPAFQQVTTALFGALGISYFMKHWRISIIPIAFIITVLVFAGTLGVGVLIPVGVVVSLVSAHLLFKAGKA